MSPDPLLSGGVWAQDYYSADDGDMSSHTQGNLILGVWGSLVPCVAERRA